MSYENKQSCKLKAGEILKLLLHLKSKLGADVVQLGADEGGALQLCILTPEGDLHYAYIEGEELEEDLWVLAEGLAVEMDLARRGFINDLLH